MMLECVTMNCESVSLVAAVLVVLCSWVAHHINCDEMYGMQAVKHSCLSHFIIWSYLRSILHRLSCSISSHCQCQPCVTQTLRASIRITSNPSILSRHRVCVDHSRWVLFSYTK